MSVAIKLQDVQSNELEGPSLIHLDLDLKNWMMSANFEVLLGSIFIELKYWLIVPYDGITWSCRDIAKNCSYSMLR